MPAKRLHLPTGKWLWKDETLEAINGCDRHAHANLHTQEKNPQIVQTHTPTHTHAHHMLMYVHIHKTLCKHVYYPHRHTNAHKMQIQKIICTETHKDKHAHMQWAVN